MSDDLVERLLDTPSLRATVNGKTDHESIGAYMAAVYTLRHEAADRITALTASLAQATEDADSYKNAMHGYKRERDEARELNRTLHRRTQEAEKTASRKARSVWRDMLWGFIRKHIHFRVQAEDRAKAAEADNAKLREALEHVTKHLNVTDEELLRLRNEAEPKSDRDVKIWGRLLVYIVDAVLASRRALTTGATK